MQRGGQYHASEQQAYRNEFLLLFHPMTAFNSVLGLVANAKAPTYEMFYRGKWTTPKKWIGNQPERHGWDYCTDASMAHSESNPRKNNSTIKSENDAHKKRISHVVATKNDGQYVDLYIILQSGCEKYKYIIRLD